MRFLSGSVSAPQKLLAAFNGNNTPNTPAAYKVGLATSSDYGATWQTQPSPVISAGTGWESTWTAQPSLVWDGSQYVIYYTGYNGTNAAIGRATASNFYGSWTKYASNPVVPRGTTGDPDEVGAGQPVVHYDPNDSPAWKMWYHGYPSGGAVSSATGVTVCFADSTDGITWTKHGTVIGAGTAGAFNDIASDSGCVYKSGSTWYVFMAGYHSYSGTTLAKSGYCTTTNPASAASYSSLTQLTNYTGNVSSPGLAGLTWQSNQPRCIIPYGNGYLCWLALWAPTNTFNLLEGAVQVYSTDLTSWMAPTKMMLPYESWDSISAENPSVIVSP